MVQSSLCYLPADKKRVSPEAAGQCGSEGLLGEAHIARILSLSQDIKSVVRCMAVCKKWQMAVRRVESLFFNCYQYTSQLAGKDAEAMITRVISSTLNLRSLSVFHDDEQDWLDPLVVISWVQHTKPTLKELFISNRRKGAEFDEKHHPSLFWAIYGQLPGGVLEKLQLDYVAIPDTLQPLDLPCMHALRFYDVHLSARALTALVGGLRNLNILRLIDIQGLCDIELKAPALTDFVLEETAGVCHITLDTPKLRRVLLRAVEGLQTVEVVDGRSLVKLEAFIEECAPDIRINGDFQLRHAHLVYQGHCWSQLQRVVRDARGLQKLAVCIKDSGSAPADLEELVALCPALRMLSMGPDLWNDFMLGDFAKGRSQWLDLTLLRIDSPKLGNRCIALLHQVLKRCPNLKRLELGLAAPDGYWEGEVSAFSSALIRVMQRYPNVEMVLDFDKSFSQLML